MGLASGQATGRGAGKLASPHGAPSSRLALHAIRELRAIGRPICSHGSYPCRWTANWAQAAGEKLQNILVPAPTFNARWSHATTVLDRGAVIPLDEDAKVRPGHRGAEG